MNDIITDIIANNLVKRISNNRPITQLRTVKQDKHLNKCKKQICVECSKILRGDNN